jgi:hypothetical protein
MNFSLACFFTVCGMIGGGALQIMFMQALPSSPTEWTNLSASVLLGGLAVYLTTRTIPAMHKEHLDKCDALHARCERMQEKFNEELKTQRNEHKQAIERMFKERD